MVCTVHSKASAFFFDEVADLEVTGGKQIGEVIEIYSSDEEAASGRKSKESKLHTCDSCSFFFCERGHGKCKFADMVDADFEHSSIHFPGHFPQYTPLQFSEIKNPMTELKKPPPTGKKKVAAYVNAPSPQGLKIKNSLD